MFRQGSWRDFRRFVLEERRDVGNRLAVIRAELVRIGYVLVEYQTTEDDQGNRVASEQRVGFFVPERSSLGKLVQAYVAQGGNPMSISHFLLPDQTSYNDGVTSEAYPGGGVVYPKQGSINATQYDGGYMSIGNDPAPRTGGRVRRDNIDRAVFHVDHSRRWVSQEIRAKRHDLEARIIKLADLREQLEQEVTRIILAVGGTVGALNSVNREDFNREFNVASLVSFIDAVFYAEDEDGVRDMDTPNEDALAYYPFLMSDEDYEVGTEL